ncbi:hypothetical protein LfDm3_0862 [Fructilactobacillus fructivorans]|uniref:Uncharacterized protein n=1 Tax=Fructilactobacillus fructivorans TaxID=1614 RepID=A0A0C1LXS7_9LACO|nr:hypothetical protein LfDm3_0862 [Fructilactobacillus fructivorans]
MKGANQVAKKGRTIFTNYIKIRIAELVHGKLSKRGLSVDPS